MATRKEKKERKEAQKYFRQNNKEFLNLEQWIGTLVPGILWAVVIGAVYGFLANLIPFEFTVFYIIIGVAIANVLNAASGINTPQIGIASVGCTLLALIVATFVQLLAVLPFGAALSNTLPVFFSNGILEWLFIIASCVAAYLQGSENKFM